MASRANLHRETLRAALRIIQTAETLEEARIQFARMLNVFDKLEAKGIKGDAAIAEAEERLPITRAPKASAADERPVRRRGSGERFRREGRRTRACRVGIRPRSWTTGCENRSGCGRRKVNVRLVYHHAAMRNIPCRFGPVVAHGAPGPGARNVAARYREGMAIVRVVNAWQPPEGPPYKCPMCKA
jgi:hypothetical protein